MTFTLANVEIERAQLRASRFGLWSATVCVDGAGGVTGNAIPAGTVTDLVLGNLTLRGVVGPGGTFAAESTYFVTGPAPWARVVPARSYRDDRGIYLARVVRDLAAELGQPVDDVSVNAADRVVGYAWERDAGTAAGALEAVAGPQWWPDAGGALHLGARPARPIPAAVRVSVEAHRPDLEWAAVSVEDDALAALLPGAVIVDPSMPAPFTVSELVVNVEAGSVNAEVWSGVPPTERLRAIEAHLNRGARWFGLYRYRVTSDIAGRPSLVPFGDVPGLPTIEQAPKAHGLPGATSSLPGDAGGPIVLVGFAGGSPGAPYVAGYLADQPLPLSVGIDAIDEIRAGGAAAGPVANALKTNLALAQIVAALNSLGATLPSLGDVGTTKFVAE